MRVGVAFAGGMGSLAALRAAQDAGDEATLLHAPARDEAGLRALPPFVVEAQAAAMGLPLRLCHEGDSEAQALARAAAAEGLPRVAFGYVRGEEHAGWKLGKTLRAHGVEPVLPARHLPPGESARALVAWGARAFVRAVGPPAPTRWLGRFVDEDLCDDVDASLGRWGWPALRTLVVDAPAFSRRVDVVVGEARQTDEGARVDVGLAGC